MSFRRQFVCLASLAALGLGLLIFTRGSPYAGGSDSSGYLNSARLLSAGQLTAATRAVPGLPPDFAPGGYQPLGFRENAAGTSLTPTYAAGLPLHLLAAHWLVGWNQAANLVNWIIACGSGLLLVLAGRRLGLPAPWAVSGALVLWACPLFVRHCLQPMSDGPALFWCLLAVYAALRSRESLGWSALAGCATALAVLVRPTDLLIVIPVLAALKPALKHYAALVIGGLPGALFLGFYNHAIYGAVIATGYGDIGSQLGWGYAPQHALHFFKWLLLLLTPAIFLPALALPFVRIHRGRAAVLLGLWAGVFVVFYLFYEPAGETWWYLRFLLPAFPPLILAGLLTLRAGWLKFAPRPPRFAAAAAAALLVAVLGFQIGLGRRLRVMDLKAAENAYPQSAAWIAQNTAPDSIVLAMQTSGALFFYTSRIIVRWDFLSPREFSRLVAAARAHARPVYACLFAFETADALRHIPGGVWRQRAQIGQAGIWELVATTNS